MINPVRLTRHPLHINLAARAGPLENQRQHPLCLDAAHFTQQLLQTHGCCAIGEQAFAAMKLLRASLQFLRPNPRTHTAQPNGQQQGDQQRREKCHSAAQALPLAGSLITVFAVILVIPIRSMSECFKKSMRFNLWFRLRRCNSAVGIHARLQRLLDMDVPAKRLDKHFLNTANALTPFIHGQAFFSQQGGESEKRLVAGVNALEVFVSGMLALGAKPGVRLIQWSVWIAKLPDTRDYGLVAVEMQPDHIASVLNR